MKLCWLYWLCERLMSARPYFGSIAPAPRYLLLRIFAIVSTTSISPLLVSCHNSRKEY